jgi:hypothetical protein
MNLDKNDVFSVKIYFINPIDLISVVINTLIGMEFESYVINEIDKENLLKILPDNIRNVIFFCIRNKSEVDYWLKYVEKIRQITSSHILAGAFAYDNMEFQVKNNFLSQNVSIIEYESIKKNPVHVLREILTYFEAKGKRSFIRTKTYGIAEAYFYIKGRENPVYAKISDLSAYAFSCSIDNEFKYNFSPGIHFNEILFVLGGIRIRTAAKVLGFDKNHPEVFIMKFCTAKMDGDRIIFEETVNQEIKQKLHDYIRKCLKDEITEKLKALDGEKEPAVKKQESKPDSTEKII